MIEWRTCLRFIFVMLLLSGVFTIGTPAYAQVEGTPINPQASAVHEKMLLEQTRRIEGRVDLVDPTASVLIQPAGRIWRYFHEVLLRWVGAVVILGTIACLAIFYLVVGPLRISAGPSGVKVLRFDTFERAVHWMTATSFVVLALTGLNITFGKLLLLPLIGPESFSRVAAAGKYVHDFMSFPFVLGLTFMAVLWLRHNIPTKVDLVWLKEGGGFIRAKHPPAGRFNAGEKLVFWLAIAAGVAIAVSGYLLMFPIYLTNVNGMQIAQVVHSIVAVLFIALIIGHIYVGTLGMEGAFEAMGTGEVDLNWAKEHHALWLEEEVAKAREPRSRSARKVAPGRMKRLTPE